MGQKNKRPRRRARRGTRPRATHDQRTEGACLFGALCPARAKGDGRVMPWCDTHPMAEPLKLIGQQVEAGAHALLIPDRAGGQTSPKWAVPDNVTLVPRPPGAPEVNPVENVWPFIRDTWLSTLVFKTCDDIADHCCQAWNTLRHQPGRAISIGGREGTHRVGSSSDGITSERLMEHVFSPEFTDTFSLPKVLQRLADNLPASALQGMPAPTASRFISLKCDLPAYNLNFLGDRQEMANSIEGRVPFLDNELADFALSLPLSALMNVREGKLPLRNAMSKRLPNYIHRGAKHVFWAPVRTVNTLLKNRYSEMALSRETSASIGIFDPDRLEKARKLNRFVPSGTRVGSALRTVLTCAVSMHMIHDMFARNFSATAANFCEADTTKELDALYFCKTASNYTNGPQVWPF